MTTARKSARSSARRPRARSPSPWPSGARRAAARSRRGRSRGPPRARGARGPDGDPQLARLQDVVPVARVALADEHLAGRKVSQRVRRGDRLELGAGRGEDRVAAEQGELADRDAHPPVDVDATGATRRDPAGSRTRPRPGRLDAHPSRHQRDHDRADREDRRPMPSSARAAARAPRASTRWSTVRPGDVERGPEPDAADRDQDRRDAAGTTDAQHDASGPPTAPPPATGRGQPLPADRG